MEPERKIEKLLRAYAQKRRGQAGGPLNLHPAPRRRLHAEIARQAPRPDEEVTSLSLWELFRQRWAVLAGFALVVFFITTLFVPAVSKSKNRAQTAIARSHLMEIGTAVRMYAEDNHERLPGSLDELTNEMQLDLNTILTDPQSGRRFVYLGAGRNLDSLPSNSVLAYSPTDKKGRAVLFADGRVEVLNGARFSELTHSGSSRLVAANDAVRQRFAATPPGVMITGGNAAAPPGSGQLAFEDRRDKSKSADSEISIKNDSGLMANAPAPAHSLAAGPPTSFKNTATPAKAASVLAHFQVQQSGNAIRIVDADGSVYDGSLLPAGAGAENETAPAEVPAPKATPPQSLNKDFDAEAKMPQTARNYFFRVTGTNLTLKQNIIFTGNLLAVSNLMAGAQQSFGGSGGGGGGGSRWQSALTNQLPWSSSCLAGTAVIAGTNSIGINAVPLSP